MSVKNAQNDSKPFVFNVTIKDTSEGAKKGATVEQPIFGIIANIQPNSQAAALSLEEWNSLLKSGKLVMAPYEKKERDHSDFRAALGL